VADGLAADAILLCGEVEVDVVSLAYVGNMHGGGIESGVAVGKGDVSEPEGMGLGVRATLVVIPGVEKEEESPDGQIGNGLLMVGGVG
jgi:hypothetical protein